MSNLDVSQIASEVIAGEISHVLLSQIAIEAITDLPSTSNCDVCQIAIEVLVPACLRTQVIGGGFQDAEGNPLAGGTAVFQLSCDAASCAGQLVSGNRKASVTLDANGNIPVSPAFSLWGNATLSNQAQTPFYIMTIYSASGQLVLQQPITIPVLIQWNLNLSGD